MKKCPYCAEEIQDAAIQCRFCKMDLKEGSSISSSGEIKAKGKGGTEVILTCPRCNYQNIPSKFKDAYSNSNCCCLAFLMVLPAILYYFLRQGKKICPQCKNVF